MTIDEFLYRSADALRNGDYLLPEVVLPAIDDGRDSLEELGEKLENNPSPPGLEGLDDAMMEAYNLFAEALDLLELAVEEDIPELSAEILSRTQDAREMLREVRRQAESHNSALQEETGMRG
ncbi:MAG TPA: hypothetical protein EYO33_25130 [Phycisphaerales bacterium]|nr:hypothetical protein [Phycisphaerales bacterium]